LAVKDALAITPKELQKLNKQELARVVRTLGGAVNKRMKRIELANLESDSAAYRYMRQTGGLIYTRNKTLNQLRNEYKRAQYFLQSAKSSTVRGTRKLKEKYEKEYGEADMSAVWDAFNWIKSNRAGMFYTTKSDELVTYLVNRSKAGIKKLRLSASQHLTYQYNKNAEELSELDSWMFS